MAYGYKIVEQKNTYNIYEIATEQTVKTFTNYSEARKFLRHLNLGGGFNGWSPSFIFRPVNVKINF